MKPYLGCVIGKNEVEMCSRWKGSFFLDVITERKQEKKKLNKTEVMCNITVQYIHDHLPTRPCIVSLQVLL